MSERDSKIQTSDDKNSANNERSITVEKLSVESGKIAILDQYMLSNLQFCKKIEETGSSSTSEEPIKEALEMFGGSLHALPIGQYRVLRNPYQNIVALVPEAKAGAEEWANMDELECVDCIERLRTEELQTDSVPEGQVFVDTRCFAVFDASLLTNEDFMKKYRDLRQKEQDKSARDFIRKSGGAVRYGFRRYGDEFGVYRIAENVLGIWPDTVESLDVNK